jgi:hypothetical protein
MEFQMRNKTFNSSMVGIAAAMSVAGSAMAATVVVDDFTAGSFSRASSAQGWGSNASPSIFQLTGSNNTRSYQALGSSNPDDEDVNVSFSQSISSTGSGSASVSLSASWALGDGATNAVNLVYGVPLNNPLTAPASSVNLTSFNAFTLFGSGTASSSGVTQSNANVIRRVVFQIYDTSGAMFQSQIDITDGAVGNLSLDLSTVTGVNMAAVRSIGVQFAQNNKNWSGANVQSSASLSYTITSVQLVPAPGALALLGVAGLVGGRRRRA